MIYALAVIGAVTVMRTASNASHWWKQNKTTPAYFSHQTWMRR